VCRRSRGTRSARDEPQSRGGSGAYPSLALLLESVGELGREQLAIDLAVGIARQGLSLLDAKRDHVLRQVLSAALKKRLAIKPRAGGRRGDENDALPQAGVRHAESGDRADEAGRIGDFLDFGRAYAVAGRLDHFIAATHEIEESLGIAPDD